MRHYAQYKNSILVATLFVLALGFFFVSPCQDLDPVPTPVKARAWNRALEIAEVDRPWKLNIQVVVIPMTFVKDGYRTYALYQYSPRVGRRGSLHHDELITLYLQPHEMCDANFEQILTHELLHAVHLRLAMSDRDFFHRHPDTEAWVRDQFTVQIESCL